MIRGTSSCPGCNQYCPGAAPVLPRMLLMPSSNHAISHTTAPELSTVMKKMHLNIEVSTTAYSKCSSSPFQLNEFLSQVSNLSSRDTSVGNSLRCKGNYILLPGDL